MNIGKAILLGVTAVLMASPPALADSISDVENARIKERSGRYLSGEDVRRLNQYGGNDDHPYYYGDHYDAPVYVYPAPPYVYGWYRRDRDFDD